MELEPQISLEVPRAEAQRRAKAGRWSQSAATKRAVIEAASALFVERGYENTSVNDIVARSGVSVGSIYHQFGGKAEVFLVLAEQVLNTHAAASVQGMRRAREAGETDPVEIYVAGAREWLIDTWRRRDLARITLGDDAPPGYSTMRRKADAKSLHSAEGLPIGDPPLADSAAHAVTGLMHSAAMQIIDVQDEETAVAVADYFTHLIRRLAQPE
jgi:AcrR family transcriptional regulator